MTSPPISWIVMPPDLTASRHAEVIMAVDSTIFTCDNLEHIDQVRLTLILTDLVLISVVLAIVEWWSVYAYRCLS
jgi:hypothetical protein